MRIFSGKEELIASTGQYVGVSRWVELGRTEADLFAITVGRVPVGDCLAAELIVARSASLMMELFEVQGRKFGLNYGLDELCISESTPVGSRVRVDLAISDCVAKPDGSVDLKWALGIDAHGLGSVGSFVALTRYQF